MRWKTPKLPIMGDTRTRYVFAWKPVKIGKYTVWLERYVVYEKYFMNVNGQAWWSHLETRVIDWQP